MDDELQQLEAELKRLRPVAPTCNLLARLERELAAPPARRARPLWWLWTGALPVAAALAVMITLAVRNRPLSAAAQPQSVPRAVTTPPAESPATFKPIAAENVLYAAQDEGLVTLEDGTPARRERLNYVDTITWKNPRTNASVRWTVPREEIRVIPVMFH